MREIKVNKLNKSITFINNEIGFSQFGIADEILDLITNLQEENERLRTLVNAKENIINETRRILGEYKHFSTPTEEQNSENEEIVDKAYIKLHSNLQELKGDSSNGDK